MWELARNIFIKGRPFYEFAGKSMTKYFRGSHIFCSIALQVRSKIESYGFGLWVTRVVPSVRVIERMRPPPHFFQQ